MLPGAEFIYDGQRYILSGQKNNGYYYLAIGSDKPMQASKCKIVKQNRGLVFI